MWESFIPEARAVIEALGVSPSEAQTENKP